MSAWRKEASNRLPELQSIIASRDIDTPAEFWMRLQFEFEKLCHHTPPPLDLLSRIWDYAKWCADQRDEGVSTAAISFFFEQVRDTRVHRKVLPSFMGDAEYAQYTRADRSK